MKELPFARLRANLPKSRVRNLSNKIVSPCDFQPRVLRTLQLALQLEHSEYNIYLAGDEGLGRTYMVRDFLEKHVANLPCPDDLVYVYNFEDEDRPKLLRLRAGEGRQLRSRLAACIKEVIRQIPYAFEQDGYTQKSDSLLQKFTVKREALLDKMSSLAQEKGFSLKTVRLLCFRSWKARC